MTTMAPKKAGHEVIRVADRFRFSDNNPLTGKPYARSRFCDLPSYATTLIEHEFGMSAPAWDALVASGEGYDVTGWRRTYSITGWLREQVRSRKGRRAGSRVCPDCFGTTVDFDTDGSVTGTTGTPILCWCAGG